MAGSGKDEAGSIQLGFSFRVKSKERGRITMKK